MASAHDIESALSRARLELLDKRKEIRETVHSHYGDLIRVSDHALCMSDRIDSLSNTFSHMLSLTKALRVRVATSQLCNEADDFIVSGESNGASSSTSDDLVHCILSLNGRVMFAMSQCNFDTISQIVKEELPTLRANSQTLPRSLESLWKPELESFACLNERILLGCKVFLGSPALQSSLQIRDCVRLMEAAGCSSSEVASIYWSRRTELLLSTPAVALLVKLFDLSIAAALASNIKLVDEFVSRFGTSNGVVGTALFNEFHNLNLGSMRRQFEDLKAASHDEDFVVEVPGMDPSLFHSPTFLTARMKQVIELAVRNVVSDLRFDIHSGDWSLALIGTRLDQVVEQVLLFGIFSRSEVIGLLGKEVDSRFLALCVEYESGLTLNWLNVATNAALLVESVTCADICSLPPLPDIMVSGNLFHPAEINACSACISEFPVMRSIGNLRELSLLSFSKYFQTLFEAGTLHSTTNAIISVQVTQGLVPITPTPALLELLLKLASAVQTLPEYMHASASVGGKRVLTSLLAKRLSTCQTNSLQDLVDAQFGIICTSSVEFDESHEKLLAHVYPELEARVLADPVDHRLFSEVAKKAALVAVSRCVNLLYPLLAVNPLYAHAKEGIDLTQFPQPALSNQVMAPLLKEKFSALPVAKNITPRSLPLSVNASKRGSLSAGVSALTNNTVTSFFNQVGKITLGSK